MAKDVCFLAYVFICIQLAVSISDKSCDPPPEFERNRPCEKELPPFPLGKNVKYCCDIGFRFGGSNRFATCMLNGDDDKADWDFPDFLCQPVSCSPPDPITNGRVVGSRYTFPNSVKYECYKGYKLQGVNQRYCETTGEWSGRIPQCKIISCPRPDDIENGTVTFLSTEYSSIATYKCSHGLIIKGNDKRRCTHEGIWDGDIPTCVEVFCPEPEDPIDGMVTLVSGGRRKDNFISYTCNKGTTLIGANLATCMENGKWSAEAPICGRPCSIPKLYRGKLGREELGWRNNWKFVENKAYSKVSEGEIILLRCNPEFELPVEDLTPGDIEIRCHKGKLIPQPSCHPAWCRGPLPDDGEGIPPSPPYNKQNGSVLEYKDSCSNIGETLKEKSALCYHGRWIMREALCKDVRCKGEDLEKLFIENSGRRFYANKERIQVRCKNKSGQSSKPNTIQCVDGQWETGNFRCRSVVRCKAEDLEKLSIDTSGKEFYDDGESIKVKCQDRFELSSEVNNIHCVEGHWDIKNVPCKPASCRYPPPAIGSAQASVSSGEHGIEVEYRCFPPYQLIQREPVTCSYGQWTGVVPYCKDTRCHTISLFGYDGVKLENKTISDTAYYSPSCMDGYDSLEVQLRCNKGIWGSDRVNNKFCNPGNCIVPFAAYGKFYILKKDRGLLWDDIYLERVNENSVISHSAKLNFLCTEGRKFQGKFETTGNGIEVFCNKKQWIPKPECWFFPQTTTVAPTTIDKPLENRSDINNENGSISDFELNINNQPASEIVPNVLLIQNISESCEFNNSDKHLLIFFNDEVVHTGVLPHGSTIKFGCQPIGMRRLDGPNSANCKDGEWEPKSFPTCVAPKEAKSVVIRFYSDKGYDTYPEDVVRVQKHSSIDVECYELNQRSRPRLTFKNLNKTIIGKNGENYKYNIVFTYITILNFTEESSGIYTCSSASDLYQITILIKENKGSRDIACPRLNTTSHLLITYDPLLHNILPDTKASFSCTGANWELRGSERITCLENGKWSSDPPICIHKCWPLPNINHGHKNGDSIDIGSVVIYSCDKGYQLNGSREITCNDDGKWSSTVPRCSVIRCPVPTKISNGQVSFSALSFDSEIEYRCNNGYKLTGNSKLRCMDNGKWSNDPPVCEEDSTGCSAHHLLEILPEGVFGENITAEQMPVRSVVQLVCDGKSQVLLGSKYAICSSDGSWKVEDTKCVFGCYAVEKPRNSSLIIEDIKDVYRFGDFLTFSCPDDKVLSIRLERIVCLGTGWSDQRLPSCIPLKT